MNAKPFKNKNGNLTLVCEWKSCCHVYDCMYNFLNHIDFHLQEFSISPNTNLFCEWKNCHHDTTFDNFGELTRHLKYHAFHQKLKCKGLNFVEQWRKEKKLVITEPPTDDIGTNTNETTTEKNSYSFSGLRNFCNTNSQEINFLNKFNFNITNNHSEKTNDNLFKHTSNIEKKKSNKINNASSTTTSDSPCHLGEYNQNLIPDLPNPFICNWDSCQKEFNCADSFYTHVNWHPGELPPSKHLACRWVDCESNGMKTVYKLKCHLRSHSQEKVVACGTCGSLFANPTKLLDHILRQADIHSQKYRCSHCSKLFTTERLLRDHMRQHVNYYKCPFCDMTCPTPASLRTHIHFRHSEDRPYPCDQCPFKAKTGVDLRKHLDTHEEGGWMECSETGCTFRSRFSCDLALHFKNKHQGRPGNRYKCHICFSCFSRGAFLSRHLKSKHKIIEPSGHVRLRYEMQADGFYRLQEFRYESSELREQQVITSHEKNASNHKHTSGDKDISEGGEDNSEGAPMSADGDDKSEGVAMSADGDKGGDDDGGNDPLLLK